MGIKVQYVGDRSYCEILVDKQKQGFSRNMIKELPTGYVERHIRPQIEIGGSKAWLIVDDTETKSKAMKAVVEETVPEPVAEETIDVDYSSMTRFQLMAIAKERGHTVKNTTKKADLLEMLSE